METDPTLVKCAYESEHSENYDPDPSIEKNMVPYPTFKKADPDPTFIEFLFHDIYFFSQFFSIFFSQYIQVIIFGKIVK